MRRGIIEKLLSLCDGRSIYSPATLREHGLPATVCRELTKKHRSDLNVVGGQLTVGAVDVEHIRGIHDLDLLKWIALRVDADTSGVCAYGRGARASQYKEAIRTVLEREVAK